MIFNIDHNFNTKSFFDIDGVEFILYTAEIYKKEKINVFCCLSESEFVLEKSWEEITDFINHDYLCKIASDFERWNSYLLFYNYEGVSRELQYLIENDKFAIRKVVFNANLKSENIDTIESKISTWLNQKILLSGINLDGTLIDCNNILYREKLTSISKKLLENDPDKLSNKDFRDNWLKELLQAGEKK